MGNKVKKIVSFRFNQYKDIELKLEEMAQSGLFLEKVGAMFWTFKKAEPKNLKYTVTYFSEASVFNSVVTDNQQMYFDYAKEAGWSFVAEFNQMQIFCSEDENPIPFQTDEREKFDNIKKCMRKNFLPSTIAMILIFMLNLIVEYRAYAQNLIDFLAETRRLFLIAIILPTVIYFTYLLVAYLIWCRQCEKSLSMGGGCIEKRHRYQKTVDVILISYNLILVTLYILDMFQSGNLALVILGIIHIPILMFIFRFSIQYLKKKKQSATFNRIVSYTVLTVASFAYIFFVMIVIIKFDILYGEEKDYRTITWQMTSTETREYKIYNEDIPLRCEDLYEDITYDNYSYEKNMDDSIFLRRSHYRQDSLPGKNSPPRIEYMIIEPKFDFVYDIVVEDLRKIPEWSHKKIEKMDNSGFSAEKAYQFYYNDKNYNGECLLLYKDKIVWLDLEDQLTERQADIIVEKLKLDES